MPPLEKLLTMQEAADALSISRKGLLANIRAGRLAYVNVGLGEERESRRFRPSDIAAFVQAQRRTCQTATPATRGKRRSAGSECDMRVLLAEGRGTRGLLARQSEERRKATSR